MAPRDASRNDPRFVEYFSRVGETERARQRAIGILQSVLRARLLSGVGVSNLTVADIGCNVGIQSRVWLEAGHRVNGIDIGRDLVNLARQRNKDFAPYASFDVCSATDLPWPNAAMDVCLLPELIEHVGDWESCLREAVRVLKPGGTLFVSTTNSLCPLQQEFTLPGYSWYPDSMKAYFVKRATMDSPQLVNYATFPAVNWFTPYGLSDAMKRLGLTTFDRFDLMNESGRGWSVALAVRAIRLARPIRFLAHVATQGTVIVGQKTIG